MSIDFSSYLSEVEQGSEGGIRREPLPGGSIVWGQIELSDKYNPNLSISQEKPYVIETSTHLRMLNLKLVLKGGDHDGMWVFARITLPFESQPQGVAWSEGQKTAMKIGGQTIAKILDVCGLPLILDDLKRLNRLNVPVELSLIQDDKGKRNEVANWLAPRGATKAKYQQIEQVGSFVIPSSKPTNDIQSKWNAIQPTPAPETSKWNTPNDDIPF